MHNLNTQFKEKPNNLPPNPARNAVYLIQYTPLQRVMRSTAKSEEIQSLESSYDSKAIHHTLPLFLPAGSSLANGSPYYTEASHAHTLLRN